MSTCFSENGGDMRKESPSMCLETVLHVPLRKKFKRSQEFKKTNGAQIGEPSILQWFENEKEQALHQSLLLKVGISTIL